MLNICVVYDDSVIDIILCVIYFIWVVGINDLNVWIVCF